MSKTVYLKSSLSEWRALIDIGANCVSKKYGGLLLFAALSRADILRSIDFLASDELKLESVIAKEGELRDFLFLLKLDLYRALKPMSYKLPLSKSCAQSILDSRIHGPEGMHDDVIEVMDRLSHFEAILRDRIGIDNSEYLRTPLRKRRVELINSLRDALRGQYQHEWLLPR